MSAWCVYCSISVVDAYVRRKEIRAMSARLYGARKLLFETLTNKLKTPAPSGDWSPIQRSVGLYR